MQAEWGKSIAHEIANWTATSPLRYCPAALASHPERLARFEREAKVLAALNHPNIATIYGREDRAIVMEMIEGPTLADRLSAGPLALDDTVTIAQQIVAALEAAHDKGIVHRHLKPANVKAPLDGPVKVLDFGLATAIQGDRENQVNENSPTLTMGATEAGVILGTASYMSPEQASGKPVDKRADIWSFGVVLWEMLTGARLFPGSETVSHVLADVLRAPIDFSKLPASTPPGLVELLKRCLDRDARTRLRDIGEARVMLARLGTFAEAASRSKSGTLAKIAASAFAVALLIGAADMAWILLKGTPTPPHVIRFEIPPPDKTTFNNQTAFAKRSHDRLLRCRGGRAIPAVGQKSGHPGRASPQRYGRRPEPGILVPGQPLHCFFRFQHWRAETHRCDRWSTSDTLCSAQCWCTIRFMELFGDRRVSQRSGTRSGSGCGWRVYSNHHSGSQFRGYSS
jgi:serine/threonine protein kinase